MDTALETGVGFTLLVFDDETMKVTRTTRVHGVFDTEGEAVAYADGYGGRPPEIRYPDGTYRAIRHFRVVPWTLQG